MIHSGRPRGTVHCRQVVQSTALVGDNYVPSCLHIDMYVYRKSNSMNSTDIILDGSFK